MKTIKILLLTCCVSLIFFSSCKEYEGQCSEVKIPKNLSPIDWDNYNEVYTVHWNYSGTCTKMNKNNDIGKVIKVYGWIEQESFRPEWFYLVDKDTNIAIHSYSIADSLRDKFSTFDITKKCYITGILNIEEQPNNNCCYASPKIVITNIDNINFE